MPVAEKCTKILKQFDVTYQLRVASAHRRKNFYRAQWICEMFWHFAHAAQKSITAAPLRLAAGDSFFPSNLLHLHIIVCFDGVEY